MKILVSAGEQSGDEHAAAVIRALRPLRSELQVRGLGGARLRAEGSETVLCLEERGSHMGFSELFTALPAIFSDLKKLSELAQEWKPDLALLVDYQDFNALLAKRLKKLGVPVLQFIAPSVWAWREGRVKNLEKNVDLLASIFPFEPEFFERLGFTRCVYVGHPLHDDFSRHALSPEQRQSFRSELGVGESDPLVALFPGSRKREFEYHLEALLEGFRLARQRVPELKGIISLAEPSHEKLLKSALKADADVKLVSGRSLEVLQSADIGALKSGTTNLQAAFAGLPFFMFYKTNFLTQMIVELFVKTKQYSIVNIIRPKTVHELIKSDFTSKRIGEEIVHLLTDEKSREEQKSALLELRQQFSSFEQRDELSSAMTAAERVAQLALTISRN